MTKNSRFLQHLAAKVAAGSSVRAAASEVGCSERQAYLLANTGEFKDTVSRLRTEMIQRAAAVLAANATAAADALVKLLSSDDEKVVLAAASKIMATLHPLSELAELRERIERLERQPMKVAR